MKKTNWVSRVLGALSKKFSHPGAGGTSAGSAGFTWWNWGRRLPGSEFDYRAEAGILWQNSVVFACMSFTATAFNEAELVVQRREAGKWITIPDHPLVSLIAQPNPFYNGDQLWAATILSVEASGNGYWRKIRNRLGAVVELWYIPHWMMWPVWDKEGKFFIKHYNYFCNGQVEVVAVEDIVHFRSKFLDPSNPRMGISPLDAVLREVCTDNEASTFMAALLRNGGFPGIVVSPKNDIEPLEKSQRESIKAGFDETYTGDGRGGTLVQSIPIEIEYPTYSPDKLVLEKVRGLSEERICAVLEVPPVVVQMGTGLRHMSAKASHRDSKRQAYDSKIIPFQKNLVLQATHQLLPDFETSTLVRISWDWSQVLVLQDDLNERAKRLALACGGPWLTVNEVREQEGLQKIAEGDKLREPFQEPTSDNSNDDKTDATVDDEVDKRDE